MRKIYTSSGYYDKVRARSEFDLELGSSYPSVTGRLWFYFDLGRWLGYQVRMARSDSFRRVLYSYNIAMSRLGLVSLYSSHIHISLGPGLNQFR